MEGTGTWEHWQQHDPQRLESMLQAAKQRLQTRLFGVDLCTDSDDGEVTLAERHRVTCKRVLAALTGWVDYANYIEDFQAGIVDLFAEQRLRPDVHRRALATMSLILRGFCAYVTLRAFSLVSSTCYHTMCLH